MFLSAAGGQAAGGIHMFLSACFSIFVYHTETYAMNILSARVFSYSQKYRNKCIVRRYVNLNHIAFDIFFHSCFSYFFLISFIPGPRRWHSGAEVLFRYA